AGGLEAGTLLSQMLYWCDKGKDGWFYKSYVEWEDEVFLSEYQVRKHTKQFIEWGIVETKLQKVNGAPVLHYRIIRENFSEWILKNLRNHDTEKFQEPINIDYLQETTEQTPATQGEATPAPAPTPASLSKQFSTLHEQLKTS